MGLITPLQGILFDFDGLIVDTESAIYQAWEEIHRELGLELDLGFWSKYVGKSIEETDPVGELLDSLGDNIDRKEMKKRISQAEEKHVSQTEILPGVQKLIIKANTAGLKLGIVSSSDKDWIDLHLERLGLAAYFDDTATSDEVPRAKPDPMLYQLGLEKIGLKKEKVIVFEDSPNGVLAAKQAGLFCIAVPNPVTKMLQFDKNGGQPDLVLESMTDFSLDPYLEEMT